MNRPKYPPTKHIVANGLQDAYYKLIKTTLNEGAIKKRFYGKPVNTYDIISLTEINHPTLEPMLHPDFPTKELHMKEYEKQFERDYDWQKQGFKYSYMDRLTKYPTISSDYDYNSNVGLEIDQLKVIKERIHDRITKGDECLVSNRDEIITWIPEEDLFRIEDQPCLQRIQFFVYKYPYTDIIEHEVTENEYTHKKGEAEFHVEWRSRDGYAAWNSNMIALIKMLIREIFEPNNLKLIRVIDFCNSLHIYEGDWESAKLVKPAILPPNLMR